ncbi:MAG: RHS repeat-associated core domain-containing protein, partial [Terriglobales bacterium]
KLAVMSVQNLVRADVPLPGGAEAVYTAGGLTAYRHADQLGSAPLASTPARTVWSAVGYAPYGDPFSSTGSDRSFTGEKQDIAPSQGGGQYDFLMREYSPVQGRWWTPDPAGLAAVDPNNPQSWNRYAYVNNQPNVLTDPSGLLVQPQPCDDGSSSCWSTTHCTVDGFDSMCSGLNGVGMNAVAACPWSGCPQTGMLMSPVNGLPYQLQLTANGWQYTGRNGDEIDEEDTWRELDLPDYNQFLDGQPTQMLRVQWDLAGVTASAPGRPPFLPPPRPQPPAQISSSIQFSRSYAAFLACEYGHTLGDERMAEAWGAVNGATLVAILSGNVKAGLSWLGTAAVFDIGGAAAINRGCSYVTYGQ